MRAAGVASLAEARYRRLLRAYPPQWREQHGDALIGVLLDAADAERRSMPTAREALDLTLRGWHARVRSEGSIELRRRVASISVGLGAAFALVSFVLFRRPGLGAGDLPIAEVGPTAILLAWVVVVGAVTLRLGPMRRAAPLIFAALVPLALLAARGQIATVVTGWASPSNADAGFLVSLAVLAALAPIDRRLVVRTGAGAVVAFAVAFRVTGRWQDSYGQALWGTPSRWASAAPGTLQALWNPESGRMPLTGSGGGGDLASTFGAWAESTVLRLDILTTAAVLVALVIALGLTLGRRSAGGRALLLLTCPFVVALLLCAADRSGVWFQ